MSSTGIAPGQVDPHSFGDNPRGYVDRVLGLDYIADKQIEILEALRKPPYKVFVQSGHKWGKCVESHSMITLSDGRRVQAKDLIGKRFELLTLVAHQVEAVKAKASWNDHEPVFEIVTETGRTIVRNGEHPLWSAAEVAFGNGQRSRIRNPGWKAAKDFVAGDVIALAESLPAFGTKSFSDDEVKVVAYLIGDGCLKKGQLMYSQTEGKCVDEFYRICKKLGANVRANGHNHYVSSDGTVTKRYVKQGADGTKTVPINPVRKLIQRLGLAGKGSHDKFIPDDFFQLSREQMCLFLSRLYSTDGWACPSKLGGRGEIGYSSVSRRLIEDVQAMLLRIGIHANAIWGRKTFWVHKGKRTDSVSNCLTIHNSKDLLLFCREIGIFGKEEPITQILRAREAFQYDRSQWKHLNALPGTRWDKVVSIKKMPAANTVAIEVPHHHTYLTDFYEHNTAVGAMAVNWFYDSFDPGGIITISPRKEHLVNVLWKDIRLLRQNARVPLMRDLLPRAPEMRSSVNHYAMGITASKGERVQGRHEGRFFVLMDECVALDQMYFTTTKGMFKPDGSCSWLALCNPTDTTSQAYIEATSGDWTVIQLSCLDHPNVEAHFAGKTLPIPRGVTKEMIDGWVHSDWCEQIHHDDRQATDFAWPPLQPGQKPEKAKWWRPYAEMEARCLGVWPSSGTYGVWSENLWRGCLVFDEERHAVSLRELPEIGCDVARYGDDNTAIHSRWSALSLAHETHNGWATTQTTGRLIEVARELADMANDLREPGTTPAKPEQIPIKVDDDGVGGGVVDRLLEQGYNAIGVIAGSKPTAFGKYKNRRSELWFNTAGRARVGMVCLARLSPEARKRLKVQAMAPTWKLDSASRRVVEEKKETKAKLGHSPDDMDAMNLAYHESRPFEPGAILPEKDRAKVMTDKWQQARKKKRRLFGD